MFEIKKEESGRIIFIGKLDASQVEAAREVLDKVQDTCVCDFGRLEYISSAGLGLFLKTQKRLKKLNRELKLVNLNKHIRNIFHIAGFDLIFDIE